MPKACLCGRRAVEGYSSCERHLRKKAWKGGDKYKTAYASPAYKDARRRLLTAAKGDPNARCGHCGRGPDPADPWEADHIVPLSRGGSDLLSNLQLAHGSCNRKHGARLGGETSAKRHRPKDPPTGP